MYRHSFCRRISSISKSKLYLCVMSINIVHSSTRSCLLASPGFATRRLCAFGKRCLLPCVALPARTVVYRPKAATISTTGIVSFPTPTIANEIAGSASSTKVVSSLLPCVFTTEVLWEKTLAASLLEPVASYLSRTLPCVYPPCKTNRRRVVYKWFFTENKHPKTALFIYIYFDPLYSLSDTGCSQTMDPFSRLAPRARWLTSLSGVAPCQCSTPERHLIMSP